MRALMIVLTVLCFVCVNTFALPLVAWMTFGGSEAWAILWMAGALLLAFLINAGIIQQAYSIWKRQDKFYWAGLLITAVEIAAFAAIAFYITSDTWAIGLILIAVLCSVALLFVEIRTVRKAERALQA